eukprot:scaffold2754_cov388-Prasinococcus_capsulatus_cf.AAC.4
MDGKVLSDLPVHKIIAEAVPVDHGLSLAGRYERLSVSQSSLQELRQTEVRDLTAFADACSLRNPRRQLVLADERFLLADDIVKKRVARAEVLRET